MGLQSRTRCLHNPSSRSQDIKRGGYVCTCRCTARPGRDTLFAPNSTLPMTCVMSIASWSLSTNVIKTEPFGRYSLVTDFDIFRTLCVHAMCSIVDIIRLPILFNDACTDNISCWYNHLIESRNVIMESMIYYDWKRQLISR